MSRGIRRTVIVTMVLITVFLIFSSGAFSRTFVRIDLEGLKNIHVRADIYEDNGGSNPNQKHGRIQVMIKEETAHYYNYKFMLDLRKASKNTNYSIQIWTDLPNIEITIHGDGTLAFWLIENVLVDIGIDKYGVDGKVVTSLEKLGLEGYHLQDTGIVIKTNDRGSYKNIKAGNGIWEMDAIEWLIDFGSPILKDRLLKMYPEYTDEIEFIFGQDRNFADFHIKGVTIPGGEYRISMGAKFVNETKESYYTTEEITYTHNGNFEWWVPGPP